VSQAALVDGYLTLLKASLIPPRNLYCHEVLATLAKENPKIHAVVYAKIKGDL
jgi:hypothetical protein